MTKSGQSHPSRRALLGATAAAALLPVRALARSEAEPDSWAPVAAILRQIKAPVFPAKDFDITKYGAVAGDQTKTSAAIAAAIDACTKAGGGRVVVPAGTWATGPIVLKSKVNLYLAKDATLAFSRNPADYPLVLTRFEGVECMNYQPFIYAFGETDLAITGEGTLDGQADADHWWDWTRIRAKGLENASKRIGQLAAQGVPPEKRIVGDGGYLRPNFVQPYRCKNILFEGIKIVRSPMWELNPVLCENITVRKVRVDSIGPNNDGCDPECCKNVLIEDCVFNTGDDCIAIKSGRNADGRRVNTPSENIVIRNCQMIGGHGGVSLGSEASGGIRNIYVRDCHMGSPNLDRALRIKTNSFRGGYIQNVVFRDVKVDQVSQDILQVTLDYGEGRGGGFNPKVGNVRFENVTCGKAKRPFDINGYDDDIIEAIDVRNCVFDNVAGPAFIANAKVTARGVKINGANWQPVLATAAESAAHSPGANSAAPKP
jgi:polygalacturonase